MTGSSGDSKIGTRGSFRTVRDVFAAYIRIDIIEDRMFPLSTALRYVAVVVPVLLYFFQAEFLGAKDQFAITLIGVSVAAGLQEALTGFTGRLLFAQERGTLETFLVEPVSWRWIPIAMNMWRSLTGVIITLLMLFIGVLLGADIQASGLPLFVVILILGIAACNAVGLFAASFLILFKRGEPVIQLYGLAAALLGGTLFAISVLPVWIRWASFLVPHAYVISAERSVLMENPPADTMGALEATIALVVFIVVAFLVGLWLFRRALEYARRTGVLST